MYTILNSKSSPNVVVQMLPIFFWQVNYLFSHLRHTSLHGPENVYLFIHCKERRMIAKIEIEGLEPGQYRLWLGQWLVPELYIYIYIYI